MSQLPLTDKVRTVLRNLIQLAADRAEAEEQIEQTFRTTRDQAEKEYQEGIEQTEFRHQHEKQAAETDHREHDRHVEDEFTSKYSRTQRSISVAQDRINEKADANELKVRQKWEEARWVAETVYEAKENQPRQHYEESQAALEDTQEQLKEIRQESRDLLKQYRQKTPTIQVEDVTISDFKQSDAEPALAKQHEAARIHLEALRSETTARLFRGPGIFLLAGFLIAISVVAAGLITSWQSVLWPTSVGLATLVVLAGLIILLHATARQRIRVTIHNLEQSLDHAHIAADACLEQAQERRQLEETELRQQRDRELAEADEKYGPLVENVVQRREHHLSNINEKYPQRLADLKQRRDDSLQRSHDTYRKRLSDADQKYESDTKRITEKRDHIISDNETTHQQQWEQMESQWKQGMAETYAMIHQVNDASARYFPEWTDTSWKAWKPPHDFIPAIRFGEMQINLAEIPGGIPQDQRLILDEPTNFTLPAFLAFPEQGSLLLESSAEGRPQAMLTLQLTMFRLLTSFPPGKVRFTIIDPVGLGQNFAGFMHLADFQEAIVGGKIWTESRHIEQRLADLTEHMENVIQKYLRNEFETIGEYNEHAGEIAEPYRFLVIADLPTNFTDTAAQRLASVINSGKRCGVYTLIAADSRNKLPTGLQREDLRRQSATLMFKEDRFVYQDDDYSSWPLVLDTPPSEAFLTHKLKIIGEAARDSSRVEVPFQVIAPPENQLWSHKTTHEVRIPLGRAGATKLQYLELGHGTAQHVLIAGKTGSGKSTLLHVLITNLALWFSPQEVEFYLVDFKKGVEFKTYATHDLPHARVVAIESDREFGLSALQRLDGELKHRGNLFRELGVQDLPGYRTLDHVESLPRILLIIDEFQELFVEDDKIGQDAALLMDRLVRQGRAFGIHVLLGSQTLGGAYTLARSTIEQMAVRIALQCSEADSYLIFGDDNAAARLLARPGEAIYNDMAGTVEGNSPFQICWLPEADRESSLEQVDQQVLQHKHDRSEPLIVFEGNVPADLTRNQFLSELISRNKWPKRAPAPRAWLGEAIAIKDPTMGTLRRQSGSNLIIVGQRDDAALAMLASSMLSLALQHPPNDAQFYILDGSPSDSPHLGQLDQLAELTPHETHTVAYRQVADVVQQLAAEVEQRQEADDPATPSVYLFIHCLQRYRQLRHVDEFSFTADPDAQVARPDQCFTTLLRDGPPVGIHTVAWCDTAANFERTCDRASMREFELRVLFQMGATDSSNLIDSPVASKLGLRRALFFSEEQGTLEKFRPYAFPEADWLEHVAEQLRQRSS